MNTQKGNIIIAGSDIHAGVYNEDKPNNGINRIDRPCIVVEFESMAALRAAMASLRNDYPIYLDVFRIDEEPKI